MTGNGCPGPSGILGGKTFATAAAALRLRLNNRSATTPASNAPNRTARPPISSPLFDPLEVGVLVLLPPVFPEFVPFVVGVWLLPTVGDAPAVGVAVVAVALAVAVAVGVVVGVTLGVTVGDGVGDGWDVGEGDTVGAL